MNKFLKLSEVLYTMRNDLLAFFWGHIQFFCRSWGKSQMRTIKIIEYFILQLVKFSWGITISVNLLSRTIQRQQHSSEENFFRNFSDVGKEEPWTGLKELKASYRQFVQCRRPFLIEQSISCSFHDMTSNNVTSCSPWGVSVTSLFHTFQHATHIIHCLPQQLLQYDQDTIGNIKLKLT